MGIFWKIKINKILVRVFGVIIWLILSSSKDSYIFPKATYYHAKNGSYTASGDKINKNLKTRWIAVSPDFIKKKGFNFGDTVIIESDYCSGLNGEWIIKDLMNNKWKNKIDFLLIKKEVNSLKFHKPHTVKLKKK